MHSGFVPSLSWIRNYFTQLPQTKSASSLCRILPANEAGKSKVRSQKEEYTELGVPEEWIPVLQELGYTTVEKLKEVEKPGKLANDLNGYNKKNTLGLKGLSPEIVEGWLENAGSK